jgi:hypothetical protein
MKVALICSLVRPEEKLLIEAFQKHNIPVEVYDDRQLVFNLEKLDFWKQ